MGHSFTLDVSSFEKLLAAAWVLQCQRDQEVSTCLDGALGSSNQDPAAVAVTSQSTCSDQEKAVVAADRPRVCSTESDLSPAANSRSEPDPIPLCISVVEAAAPVENDLATMPVAKRNAARPAWVQDSLRAIGSAGGLHAVAASVEPLLVLVVMVAFLLSEPWKNAHAGPKLDVQSSRTAIGDLVTRDETDRRQPEVVPVSETEQFAPSLESSHGKVTDPATSVIVEALSRYEIKGLRRQAQYGDDSAALTLGMAYETGRHVHQSCTKAADWVTLAAEEDNAAAQYNLALRYQYGDGVPADSEEAKKWLQKSAAHGYPKAESVLQVR